MKNIEKDERYGNINYKNKKKVNKKKKIKRKVRQCISILILLLIIIIGINSIINKDIAREEERIINENPTGIDSGRNTNKGIETIKGIPIINKEYGVGQEYEPKDLRVVNVLSNKTIELREEAAKNVEILFEKAEGEGIYLMAAAGYRTYDFQKQLYNNEVSNYGKEYADKYVARPGHSEHHTGLVIDLMSADDVSLTEDFDKTPEFRWLQENMSDYGFILRYPKEKEDITGYNYEPWHIRYVGVEVAKAIEESGLTLEEYLNK